MLKKILFLLLLGLTITGLMFKLLPLLGPSNNAVDIAQAEAVIEAARAAQSAAEAAKISAQGLSDVARGQTTILLLLTLQVVLVVSGLFWFWYARQKPASTLAPPPQPRALPDGQNQALPDLTALIQLEQLRLLNQLRPPHQTPQPALLEEEEW